MIKKPISSHLEDYLEAIAEIMENAGHVHASAVAEKLKVSKPSVTNALQTLAAKGYIEYKSHMPVVKLSVRGAERAAVIRRRHAALKNFFRSLLKLEEQEASDLACKIEHEAGQKVVSRIVTLTEAILQRKDCAQLRTYLEEAMPSVAIARDDDLIDLASLQIGQNAVVSYVSPHLRGVRKFADLGLVPGTLLCVEGRAPFGDLLRVRVMGSSLSMRGADAAKIWVRCVT